MIAKNITLFIWAFILLGITAYFIKQFLFRKKKTTDMNMAEGIYLSALIISVGIIFQSAMQSITTSYDNSQKLVNDNFLVKFAQSSSSISVIGIIAFILALFTAKFISSIFIGNRNRAIELESDNKVYSLIQGALIIVTCMLFSAVLNSVFINFIPTISIPNLIH